ncbi:MAG: branched-chain amino acid ABC transporter ATP-binding protein [Deltaproteobacteria bacterium RBG_19FT_COMBO_46_9]|nr:MAG: branched-chain amino acid ABC transporter ATP-binding protein [Deltaproteobacteria bacterium RBG_19FT_COMBO_46_9]
MLSVKCLNVFYGDAQALWDVSFEVPEDKMVTIIGSNGAGKTTLIKTISNLLEPRSGEIQIDNQVTTGLPAHRVVELGVAHVPEGRQLFPMMTVYENLKIGAILPEAKRRRSETLQEVFELFPVLGERREQLANTLSGGEQQMLAIARGLMLRPKLILLDEPSSGLAPLLVSQIFEIIKEIKRRGITVLLVEQNVQRSLELADQGFVLENGRVTMQGTGSELLANDHIRKAYLGL